MMFEFKNVSTVLLDNLINEEKIKLGRGNVISKSDIRKDPGVYPIYSSSSDKGGEMGQYGKYMFDEKNVETAPETGKVKPKSSKVVRIKKQSDATEEEETEKRANKAQPRQGWWNRDTE